MTDTTTLRERLARVAYEKAMQWPNVSDHGTPLYRIEFDDDAPFSAIEPAMLLWFEQVASSTAETLLAEIEARCAARGYTTLVGFGTLGMSIANFLAELRGEVQGEQ